MAVYIDSEFKCHTTNLQGVFREVKIDLLDGKCDAFIEGYRFIPSGESWAREDGVVFHGEMLAPWKTHSELDEAQRQHEQELAQAALILLGEVNV